MMEFRAAFGWPEMLVYMGCFFYTSEKYLYLQQLEYIRNGTEGQDSGGICAQYGGHSRFL